MIKLSATQALRLLNNIRRAECRLTQQQPQVVTNDIDYYCLGARLLPVSANTGHLTKPIPVYKRTLALSDLIYVWSLF